MKDVILGIGVPSNGSIKTKTSFCITATVRDFPGKVLVFLKEGCYVHFNREDILESALKSACTHLWFVDTDMVFPSTALTQLLSLNKDIAAARYNQRTYKQVLSTTKTIDADGTLKDLWLDDMPREPFNRAGKPLLPVLVPTGMMVIRLDALRKMTRPFFYCEDGIGEDVFFCKKAIEAGVEIWCDPTIEVGHIGEVIF